MIRVYQDAKCSLYRRRIPMHLTRHQASLTLQEVDEPAVPELNVVGWVNLAAYVTGFSVCVFLAVRGLRRLARGPQAGTMELLAQEDAEAVLD